MFTTYKNCSYCKSTNLIKDKDQEFKFNFYLDAIMSHFNLLKKDFSKMKVFSCKNCFIKQNSPWFDKEHAVKIYSNAYSQHNKGWSNLINFKNRGILPDHGDLFSLLIKNIKVKNYAEFNSPFMGLLLNIFESELKEKKVRKVYIDHSINYLSARQLAGYSMNKKQKSNSSSKNIFNKLRKIKKFNFSKKK